MYCIDDSVFVGNKVYNSRYKNGRANRVKYSGLDGTVYDSTTAYILPVTTTTTYVGTRYEAPYVTSSATASSGYAEDSEDIFSVLGVYQPICRGEDTVTVSYIERLAGLSKLAMIDRLMCRMNTEADYLW